MSSVLTIQVLVIFTLSVLSRSQNDLTTESEAAGTKVVLASIAQILESRIFPDDNRLLRRVAHVVSRDGTNTDTYRDGYNGGIWQVDEDIFMATIDQSVASQLSSIYVDINVEFGVDWTQAGWQDLRIPLFSALAARIFFSLRLLSRNPATLPDIGDVRGQGQFLNDIGFYTDEGGFEEAVIALELEECPNRGIDLAFVLDSSGSVGSSNFVLERDLVSNVVQRFSIGSNATQVAVISYSGFATINFQLDNFTNSSELQRAISEVEYSNIPGTGTNTADALLRLRTEVFVASGGARSEDVAIPRVAVVITDGRSNVNSEMTIPMAIALRESGATVYAVGVGSNINMEELEAIASSPDNVRLLNGFDTTEFDGLRSRITNDACTAIVSIEIAQIINIVIPLGEVAFFDIQLPEEGLTISLVKQEGNADLFASDKIRNPSSAFNNYMIEEEGEVFVDIEELRGLSPKREAVINFNLTNTTLFVSIEGIGENNVYQIMTTHGNTVSSATGIYTTYIITLIFFIFLSMNL